MRNPRGPTGQPICPVCHRVIPREDLVIRLGPDDPRIVHFRCQPRPGAPVGGDPAPGARQAVGPASTPRDLDVFRARVAFRQYRRAQLVQRSLERMVVARQLLRKGLETLERSRQLIERARPG